MAHEVLGCLEVELSDCCMSNSSTFSFFPFKSSNRGMQEAAVLVRYRLVGQLSVCIEISLMSFLV